jgi:tRNA(adenine34) deaminase
MILLAIDAAEEGLRSGELPIGAVVVMGENVLGRAFTKERTLKRRLVHADLLAMTDADERLGRQPRTSSLQLAVNLEPCLMCVGAAMTLGIAEVYFGLESPADGAAGIAAQWRPAGEGMPSYTAPTTMGGIRRTDVRDQFRRYCDTAPDSGLRRWAETLASPPGSAPA